MKALNGYQEMMQMDCKNYASVRRTDKWTGQWCKIERVLCGDDTVS